MTFDRNEIAELLLRSVQGAAGDEPGTITTRELREATGLSLVGANRVLDAALAAGILEPLMVQRRTRGGVPQRWQGYRLKEFPPGQAPEGVASR